MQRARTSTAIACCTRTTDTVTLLRPEYVAVFVCIVFARRPLLSFSAPVIDEQQRRNVLCPRQGARDCDSRFCDHYACRLYLQRHTDEKPNAITTLKLALSLAELKCGKAREVQEQSYTQNPPC